MEGNMKNTLISVALTAALTTTCASSAFAGTQDDQSFVGTSGQAVAQSSDSKPASYINDHFKLGSETLFNVQKTDAKDNDHTTLGYRSRLFLKYTTDGSDMLYIRLQAKDMPDDTNAGFAAGYPVFGGGQGNNDFSNGLSVDKIFYKFDLNSQVKVALGMLEDEYYVAKPFTSYAQDAVLKVFKYTQYYGSTGMGGGLNFAINDSTDFSTGIIADKKTSEQPSTPLSNKFYSTSQLSMSHGDFSGGLRYTYAKGGYTAGQQSFGDSGAKGAASNSKHLNDINLAVNYAINDDLSATATYGYTDMTMTDDKTVKSSGWNIGILAKNVLSDGDKMGAAFGSLHNIHDSENTSYIEPGYNPYAYEAWYQRNITKNVYVKPYVFYLDNMNSTNDSNTGIGLLTGINF